MPSIKNNFDLIRLLAAAQVAVSHSMGHFDVSHPVMGGLSVFPGVPIFFFVSGYLIVGSYEKILSKGKPVSEFFRNRVLRLYPALILCFGVSLLLVLISGYFGQTRPDLASFITWSVAQLTVFQFYNLEALRGFGTGVLNGSLWTISVEIQFYLLTPVLAFLLRRHVRLFGILACVSAVFGLYLLTPAEGLIQKLIFVSFLPWVFIFMFGAFLAKSDALRRFADRVPILGLLAIYIAMYALSTRYNLGSGNNLNAVTVAVLGVLIYRFATLNIGSLGQPFGGNDYSYGIYIYHMPIVNFILFTHSATGPYAVILALCATVFCAVISWHVIEKPFLKRKRISSVAA